MLEQYIKKEPKEEEEEEENETGEEDEEKEGEGKGAEDKALSAEEEWKLQHIEEEKTEPVEKLGKIAGCYVFVCSDNVACLYVHSELEWLIGY